VADGQATGCEDCRADPRVAATTGDLVEVRGRGSKWDVLAVLHECREGVERELHRADEMGVEFQAAGGDPDQRAVHHAARQRVDAVAAGLHRLFAAAALDACEPRQPDIEVLIAGDIWAKLKPLCVERENPAGESIAIGQRDHKRPCPELAPIGCRR